MTLFFLSGFLLHLSRSTLQTAVIYVLNGNLEAMRYIENATRAVGGLEALQRALQLFALWSPNGLIHLWPLMYSVMTSIIVISSSVVAV